MYCPIQQFKPNEESVNKIEIVYTKFVDKFIIILWNA